MSQPEDRSPAWFDLTLLGLIVLTLVLSAGRVVLAVVEREPFSSELSFAVAFALLSAAALIGELSYRIRRPRPSRGHR